MQRKLSFLATIVWIEALAILRRPLWWLLVAAAALLFYTGGGRLAPVVNFGQELPFLGLDDRTIVSIGEWGRVLLLVLEMFGGMYFSLIVALVTMGTLAPEARHREVLWSTPQGGRLCHAGARLLAVTSLTTFALALVSCHT